MFKKDSSSNEFYNRNIFDNFDQKFSLFLERCKKKAQRQSARNRLSHHAILSYKNLPFSMNYKETIFLLMF